MVGRGDVGVFSVAGRCRARFPEDTLYRRFVSLYTVRCFGDGSNRAVPHRRGVSTRTAHRDIRRQRFDRYVRRFCSWRHRIEGCTVRLRAASPEVSRFSRSFRPPWSKRLRMGKICGGFVVPWSKRVCMGKVVNRSQTERRRSRNTEGKMRRVF